VKSLWLGVFGLLVVVFAGTFALAAYATVHDENKVPPEVEARQAECKKLARHLLEIAPERGGRSIDELASKVPIEDIEQCGAAYPEVVACMEQASNMEAVRACIPLAIECDGQETNFQATSPVYEVGGDCGTVTIKGTHAFVVVHGPKRVNILGDGNRVLITARKDGVAPVVQDHGTGNAVTKQ
jgi:hypothetical protein